MHGGVGGWLKGGAQRRQQGLDIALDVKEINALLFAAPLKNVVGAIGHARYSHGLVKAFNRGIGVSHRGIAQKHAAEFKHAHPLGFAVQVELEHLQQRAQQRRAHHAHLAGNGVQQLDGVGIGRQLLLPALFHKAEIDGLLVPQTRQQAAHRKRAALGFCTQLGGDRRQGRCGGQVVVTHHARHFLDQIFLDGNVKAIAGGGDRHHTFRLGHRQPQALERIHALGLGQRHTNNLGRARHAQCDRLRRGQVDGVVIDGAASRLGRAADVDHELRNALDVLHRQAGVHTALKAMARVGREVEAARTPRHGLGPPESGFDVNVARVIRHRRGVATHDAGQRFDLAVIGDHTHLVIDGDGVAIEQLELLTGLAPSHIQATVDFVQIKNMRWTAQLKHHVVRDVHQRRHATLTAAGQAVLHPLGGCSARVHVAHDATREAATQIRGAHLHGQLVCQLGLYRRERRLLQWRTGQCRHFTGNAVNAQAMRQVGRELESEERVVQIQMGANVLTHRGRSVQLQQTAVVFRQLEFAGRAQHALAFHAAQLAHLDQERLAIVARGQLGTHQRTRHLDAHTGVGRTADDIEQGALPYIDLAHTQAIGIRVLHSLLDLADHDFGERRRDRAQLFDLQACHGQGVSQLLGGQRWIAEFAQPGLGKLHSEILWRLLLKKELLALFNQGFQHSMMLKANKTVRSQLTFLRYWNCDRKRMSPSKNRRKSLTP